MCKSEDKHNYTYEKDMERSHNRDPDMSLYSHMEADYVIIGKHIFECFSV